MLIFTSRHLKRTVLVTVVIAFVWYLYVTQNNHDSHTNTTDPRRAEGLNSPQSGGSLSLQDRMQEVLAAREWLAQNSARFGYNRLAMDPYSPNRLFAGPPPPPPPGNNQVPMWNNMAYKLDDVTRFPGKNDASHAQAFGSFRYNLQERVTFPYGAVEGDLANSVHRESSNQLPTINTLPHHPPSLFLPGKTPVRSGVVSPDGGVVSPDGGVVSPDGGVVSPDGGNALSPSQHLSQSPDWWAGGGGFSYNTNNHLNYNHRPDYNTRNEIRVGGQLASHSHPVITNPHTFLDSNSIQHESRANTGQTWPPTMLNVPAISHTGTLRNPKQQQQLLQQQQQQEAPSNILTNSKQQQAPPNTRTNSRQQEQAPPNTRTNSRQAPPNTLTNSRQAPPNTLTNSRQAPPHKEVSRNGDSEVGERMAEVVAHSPSSSERQKASRESHDRNGKHVKTKQQGEVDGVTSGHNALADAKHAKTSDEADDVISSSRSGKDPSNSEGIVSRFLATLTHDDTEDPTNNVQRTTAAASGNVPDSHVTISTNNIAGPVNFRSHDTHGQSAAEGNGWQQASKGNYWSSGNHGDSPPGVGALANGLISNGWSQQLHTESNSQLGGVSNSQLGGVSNSQVADGMLGMAARRQDGGGVPSASYDHQSLHHDPLPPQHYLNPPTQQQQQQQQQHTGILSWGQSLLNMINPIADSIHGNALQTEQAVSLGQAAVKSSTAHDNPTAGQIAASNGQFSVSMPPKMINAAGESVQSKGTNQEPQPPTSLESAPMITRDNKHWKVEPCSLMTGPPPPRATLQTPLGQVPLYMETGPNGSQILRSSDSRTFNHDFGVRWNNGGIRTLFERCLMPDVNVTLIDIGANVGPVTFTAAAAGRTVYAVEPLEWLAHTLCHTVTDFHYHSVHVIHNAASDDRGKVTFRQSAKQQPTDTYIVDTRNKSKIDPNSPTAFAIRLDDILRVFKVTKAAIKIDADGFEGRVLAGAHKILNTVDIPCIMMEWKHVHSVKEYGGSYIFDLLSRFGFFPHDVTTLQPLKVFRMHNWPDDVLWAKIGSRAVRI